VLLAAKKIRILEIHITEKSETIIQIANINPNPLIKLIQKINRIIATISPVTFESQIADQDFLNQILAALAIFSHLLSSSLILSNIKILASIAIPIERIKPAIEARVRVIQRTLIIVRIIATYNRRAIEARKPDNLYTNIKNIKIIRNQVAHAISNL